MKEGGEVILPPPIPPKSEPITAGRSGEEAGYMYMGVSCPVRSLNMAAGIVFMWIWQRENRRSSYPSGYICVWCGSKRKVCMHVCVCVFNLSNRIGQGLDNLLMCRGHHALSINLNDPVTHTDATSLGNASSHQAAYLHSNTHTQINVCLIVIILCYQGCPDPDLEGHNRAGIRVLPGRQP